MVEDDRLGGDHSTIAMEPRELAAPRLEPLESPFDGHCASDSCGGHSGPPCEPREPCEPCEPGIVTDNLDNNIANGPLPASPSWVPPLLSTISSPYSTSTLPTALHWAPSGHLLAVSSSDAKVRLFSVEGEQEEGVGEGEGRRLGAPLVVGSAESVYDMCWCPGEGASLALTGRYQPIQVWRVGGGGASIEATYKCINQLDELSHAHSLAATCELLYAGLRGEVRVFDRRRPGRESTAHLLAGRRGITSCLALHPTLPVYAAGSYDRSTGLYTTEGEMLCLLEGQQGGVTQVTFTADGTRLYTGGRKDGELVGWDLRQPGRVLHTLQREAATNQRVQFTLSPCQQLLASAGTDGSVRVWRLADAPDAQGVVAPCRAWLLHGDAVTGVGWRGGGATPLLATCSGQRRFADSEGVVEEGEACVRLWGLE